MRTSAVLQCCCSVNRGVLSLNTSIITPNHATSHHYCILHSLSLQLLNLEYKLSINFNHQDHIDEEKKENHGNKKEQMFRLEKLTSHSSHRILIEFLNFYINTVNNNNSEKVPTSPFSYLKSPRIKLWILTGSVHF